MFKRALSANVDQRNTTDRRIHEQKWRHDRRVRPDRRLNNIAVEWIPFSKVTSHPTIREALSCRKNKNQAKGTPRKEQSLMCIFSNNFTGDSDLRKVTDRRKQQQLRPYDRRMHPDRRLNNISVDWIPY
jgi:hypothetical protein